MKEYLEQRIKQIEEYWNNTQQKYLNETNEKMLDYYETKLEKYNYSIRELKKVLKKVEE